MKHFINIFQIIFIILSSGIESTAQWIQTNLSKEKIVYSFANYGNNIFAGIGYGGLGITRGVNLSTDNGISWITVNNGLKNLTVYSLANDSNNLFAGTLDGIFVSTTDGNTWNEIDSTVLRGNIIYSICFLGNILFVGTNKGVFKLAYNDSSWSATNVGLSTTGVKALLAKNNYLFAATSYTIINQYNNIYVSTNNGLTWESANSGMPNSTVWDLVTTDTSIFAGTLSAGIFFSTNLGNSWSAINSGLTNYSVNDLAIYKTYLFAGTVDGVFISSNNGISWDEINDSLPKGNVRALVISDLYLFAAIDNEGIWKRSLSEITTIKEYSPELTSQFKLQQNFPNPFNSSTTITFSIPKQSFVSLKVFNLLGQLQEVLLNKELNTGTYRYQWNAKGIPSGIYFYELKAELFSEVRELIYLK